MELDGSCLNQCDIDGNYPLHIACLGVNLSVIKYLLERRDIRISERNAHGKLPFELLIESGAGGGSVQYLESLFLFLRAHPEAVMN